MCTRFVLEKDRLRELIAALDPALIATLAATSDTAKDRFNIAPSTPVLALRPMPSTAHLASPAASDHAPATPEIFHPRWGLIPSWAHGPARPFVNARAETVAEKPAFRDAFHRRRCLVPASGFYEWEARGRMRHPWVFRRRDRQAFFFAGLWESSTASDGTLRETCAIITTTPNPIVAPIHDRMPVLLDPAGARNWLHATATPSSLTALLRPAPDHLIDGTELIRRINQLQHDDSACLTPVSEAPPDDQFSFEL